MSQLRIRPLSKSVVITVKVLGDLLNRVASIYRTEHYKVSSSSGDTVNLSLEETVFAPGQLLLFQSG